MHSVYNIEIYNHLFQIILFVNPFLIYNIRRIARYFPTVHCVLNLREAARNEFERNTVWKEDTILDAGGNRSARRKPARASMDREPNSHTTLARLGIEPGSHW